MLEYEAGKRLLAVKNVTINEPVFTGHFPQRPVMPGVLILEALAQAAALLTLESAGVEIDDKTLVYFAAIDNARFKRPVEPGDQLLLDVTLSRLRQGVQRFHGQARVGSEVAAEAEMMCAIRRAP